MAIGIGFYYSFLGGSIPSYLIYACIWLPFASCENKGYCHSKVKLMTYGVLIMVATAVLTGTVEGETGRVYYADNAVSVWEYGPGDRVAAALL